MAFLSTVVTAIPLLPLPLEVGSWVLMLLDLLFDLLQNVDDILHLRIIYGSPNFCIHLWVTFFLQLSSSLQQSHIRCSLQSHNRGSTSDESAVLNLCRISPLDVESCPPLLVSQDNYLSTMQKCFPTLSHNQ